MTNNNFDLLGHPIQEHKELPHGKQLTDLSKLIGHTVKLVFEGTDLKTSPWYADAVIVTETGCFIALKVDEGEDLAVVTPYQPQSLKAFVSTKAMAREGLLGEEAIAAQKRSDELEQIRFLKESAKESRKSAADNLRCAERDEAKAAELEAEIERNTHMQKEQSK